MTLAALEAVAAAARLVSAAALPAPVAAALLSLRNEPNMD